VFKRICVAVLICLVIGSSITFAHGGRTDSKGGHWNRSEGTYHYHHGYPEHDHPNGVCPYKQDEATPTPKVMLIVTPRVTPKPTIKRTPRPTQATTKAFISKTTPTPYNKEYTRSYESVTINGETRIVKVEENQETKPEEEVGSVWPVIIIAGIILFVFYFVITSKHEKREIEMESRYKDLQIKESQERQEIAELNKTVKSYKSRLAESDRRQAQFRRIIQANRYITNREKLIETIKSKSLEEMFIPLGFEVGDDGLPREKGSHSNWGCFTFYTSQNMKKYHHDVLCHGTIPINAAQITRDMEPCKRCNPKLPDLHWYLDYKDAKSVEQSMLLSIEEIDPEVLP